MNPTSIFQQFSSCFQWKRPKNHLENWMSIKRYKIKQRIIIIESVIHFKHITRLNNDSNDHQWTPKLRLNRQGLTVTARWAIFNDCTIVCDSVPLAPKYTHTQCVLLLLLLLLSLLICVTLSLGCAGECFYCLATLNRKWWSTCS